MNEYCRLRTRKLYKNRFILNRFSSLKMLFDTSVCDKPYKCKIYYIFCFQILCFWAKIDLQYAKTATVIKIPRVTSLNPKLQQDPNLQDGSSKPKVCNESIKFYALRSIMANLITTSLSRHIILNTL